MSTIGILGAGTWGIALARVLCNKGYQVTVWSALEKELENLNTSRTHPNLPGMIIPNEIEFTKDISIACTNKNIILLAVPSTFIRDTVSKIAPYVESEQVIVNVAKGIESNTIYTMTEVIQNELYQCGIDKQLKVVALSGPTHAEEVAFDFPTTIVASCEDINVAEYVQDVFMTDSLRVYTNVDIKGVELCGALKNIIALAAGISQGLGYGDNAKAALITRGIIEISRLGVQIGCKEKTFNGLAGIGDLIVTATSEHSRNNRLGRLIGEGKNVQRAIEQIGMVVEGVNAIPATLQLAQKYQVEMPIISAVNSIINEGVHPKEIVNLLMSRDKKVEF